MLEALLMNEDTGNEERTATASSTRVEWLDGRAEETADRRGKRIFCRLASLAAAMWMLTQPLLLYVVVPCVLLLALVTAVTVFRLHPLIGGLIVAVGLGVGLTVYYEMIR